MSKLFVSDDEDDRIDESPHFESNDDLDDPVITEIPLIMKSKLSSDHVSVLQYPGRPPRRQFVGDYRVIQSRIKPSTDLIEVDVPMDTSRFFDEEKSAKWGGVTKQTLTGVQSTLEGHYIACVQNGELVLIPADSVAQLRPTLTYIDAEAAKTKEAIKTEQVRNNTMQVVQMTVKGTNDTAPRLGGALLARKKVEEEDFKVLPWVDVSDQEAVVNREELLRVTNKEKLVSRITETDYLTMLVKDTIVDLI